MNQLKLPLTEKFINWRVIYNKEKIDYFSLGAALQFYKNIGGDIIKVIKEREIYFE